MANKRVKKENTSHVEGDNHNELLSSVRTERPGNYLFNIESFSLLLDSLSKSNSDKYDSCHFDAGGYKWKLTVYPDGDKKRGGDGFVSLYLALAYPKSLPQGQELHVIFKFSVFNYRHDTYLILHDGKDRRFHALKSEWGFAKLLPHEIFKDPSQGYLVDDRCAFGVEMFFHKNETKGGLSAFRPRDTTFTWKIDKFSTLPEQYQSDVFSVGGLKWFLRLHPKGYLQSKGKSLSLFVYVHDRSSFPLGWKFCAEYELRILDQVNEKHHERIATNAWFTSTEPGRGYADFLALSDLKRESGGFIVNDTVVIEVTFTGVFLNSLA